MRFFKFGQWVLQLVRRLLGRTLHRQVRESRHRWVRAWAAQWFPGFSRGRTLVKGLPETPYGLWHRPNFLELERRQAPTALGVADLAIPPLALAVGAGTAPLPLVQPGTLERVERDQQTEAPAAELAGKDLGPSDTEREAPDSGEREPARGADTGGTLPTRAIDQALVQELPDEVLEPEGPFWDVLAVEEAALAGETPPAEAASGGMGGGFFLGANDGQPEPAASGFSSNGSGASAPAFSPLLGVPGGQEDIDLLVAFAGLLAPPSFQSSSFITLEPPETLYVDDDWAGTALGEDPDGDEGPALMFGWDAFATIQQAVLAAPAEATIYVFPGVYPEHVIVPRAVSLLGANEGTPGAEPRGDEAIIDGGGTGTPLTIIASNVQVDGFLIRNGSGANDAGIKLLGNPQDVEIVNNVIQGNTVGVSARSSQDAIVADNLFRDNTRGALAFIGLTESAHTGLTVADNTVVDFRLGQFAGVSDGFILDNAVTSTGSANAVEVLGGVRDLEIAGNTFIGGTSAVFVTASPTLGSNADVNVNFNEFLLQTVAGVQVSAGGHESTLDAVFNWWGSNAGPGTPGSVAALGDVLYGPWTELEEPLPAAPAQPANEAGTPAAPVGASAVIDNGTIQLGIGEAGNLQGALAAAVVGLRYLPTSAEAVAHGALAEGWGVADALTGMSGFVNPNEGGTHHLSLVSFTSTATTATVVVDVLSTAPGSPAIFRVTHVYQPSTVTPDLYDVAVTVENLTASATDVRYRRVIDWDVGPTPFAEFVSIGGSSAGLLFSSNDGLASANPLAGHSDLGYTGTFDTVGPMDHGALLDFTLGSLAAGQSTTFHLHLGAAASRADALEALALAGAEVYALAQPNTVDGAALGAPNTFVLGFTAPATLPDTGAMRGQQFHDLDGDGSRDAAEPGLAGGTVFLDANANDELDVGETAVTTDALGNYAFTQLAPGTYRVRAVQPDGWLRTTANPSDVTLADNEVTGVDFGNFQLAVVSGQTFEDLNADGDQDAWEPGLAGWTIYLDANDNGSLDGGEISVVTDAAGNYVFQDLGPGSYQVRAVLQPDWFASTAAPDALLVATSGQTFTDVNFGSYRQANLAGYLFEDLNGDGLRDGEPGLEGWTVFLDADGDGTLDGDEQFVASGPDGAYAFTNLTPGDYLVRAVPQAGWLHTTAVPVEVSLTSGTDVADADLGVFGLATTTGYQFDDQDGDGVWDGGEPGLEGWTIYLDANGNDALDVGERSVLTGSDGSFTFDNLGPGPHRVRAAGQSGWTQTTADPDDVFPASGETVSGIHFGNALTLISGRKFEDLDGDGAFDAGELGLAGWTIYLDANGNDALDGGEVTATTDADGRYAFVALAPGSYRVREAPQAGWLQTTTDPADIVLTGANSATDVDFGNFQLAVVGGISFNDVDADGIQDMDEAGLTGWTLYLDANGNDTFDGGEVTTTTGADGSYQFADLALGTHTVRAIVPAGWEQLTVDPADIEVTASGQVFGGVAFGNFSSASLSGQTFDDLDNDGVKDIGEPGVAAWTVYLDANDNDTFDAGERSMLTDALGHYSFVSLEAGAYRVRTVAVAGWRQTTADPADIVIGTGTIAVDVDFGNFRLATLTGRKFEDLDGDGLQGSGEAGLEGWTIFLDANGNDTLDGGEVSAVTDLLGFYDFFDLDVGTYRVREVQQPGWMQTTPNPADMVVDSSGQTFLADFGNQQAGSLMMLGGGGPDIIEFVANQGQAEPAVAFFGQTADFEFFLTADGVTFRFGAGETAETVTMQFVGANVAPAIVGSEPVTGAAEEAYARVTYLGVYDGIDLTFYTNAQGEFEYDWIVAPGADPNQIRVAYPDAEQVSLDVEGNLEIAAVVGGLLVHAPVLFQEMAGPEGTTRESVSGQYVVEGNQVSFAIGAYESSRALIIDPIVTWTGAGTTSHWSEAANWSGNAVPTAADTVIFDGTSGDDASVDAGFAGTITHLQVNAGYAGQVALERDLALLGAFAQAAGVFQGQTHTLTVATNFTVTGGAFDAGTGTVLFKSGSSGHAIDVNSAVTFHHLVFGDTGTGTRTYTLGAGDTLHVLGDFTMQATGGTPSLVANAGFIAVEGNVFVGAGAAGGTTVVRFANTTADQTYTSTGGALPAVEIANGTRVVSAAPGTTGLTVQHLTLTSGTFQAPSGTLTIRGDLTQSAGAFDAGTGTVLFNHTGGSAAHNIHLNGAAAGSLTLNHLTFGDTGSGTKTYTLGTGDTLHVLGDFTMQAGGGTPLLVSNGGTIAVQGDVTVGGGAASGTTVVQFANTTADQTYTSTGGVLPTLEIANGARVVSAAPGTTALAVRSLILTSGTFLAPSGILSITRDLFQTGGLFAANLGTVLFTSASGTATHALDVNGALTLHHLVFGDTGTGTKTYTVAAGDTLQVAGDFTLQAGSGTPVIVANTGTIAVQGQVVVGNGAAGGTTVVQFANTTADQTYTSTGGLLPIVEIATGTRTVSAAAGTSNLAVSGLTLTSGTFQAPAANLTITGGLTQTAGAFDAGTGVVLFNNSSTSSVTQTISLNGAAAGALTFNDLVFGGSGASTKTYALGTGDTLNVLGDFTMQRTGGTALLVANGGTVAVQGDVAVGAGAAGGTSVVQFANTTADQTYSSTGGVLSVVEVVNGARTVRAAAGTTDLAVSGLTLTSGTFEAPTGTLTITGSLTQTAGVYQANAGTLLFNNSSTSSVTQSINLNGAASGSLSLNHLILGGTGASTKTFSIGTGDTLHVAGNFTMQRSGGTPLVVANGGTVAVQGNVTVGAGASGGTTVLQFANTSADQTYTSTGGVLSVVEVVNGARTIRAAAGTTDLAVSGLVLTSGTFEAPTGTLTVTGSLTQTAGAFDAGSGTVFFNNASTSSVTQNINLNGAAAGSLDLHHLVFGGSGASTKTYNFGAGDTLHVAGNFTMQRSGGTPLLVTNSGTIAVQGDVTVGAGANAGTTVVRLANTSADQTYTSTGGVLPVLEVANGGRTVRAAAGTTDLAVRSLVLTGGNFAAPAGTLTITNDLIQTGGHFDAGTGTLLFNNSGAVTHAIHLNGAAGGLLNVHHLSFGDGGTGTKTYNLGAGDGFFVGGDFSAQAQAGSSALIRVNGGAFRVVGGTTLGTGYQAGTPAPVFTTVAVGAGVISGALYDDLNGDGQQQAGDPGLAGRTVELLDGSGAVIATTQTGTTGYYQFLDVAPGAYTVRPVTTTGWSPTTGSASTVTVAAGAHSAADFGAFQHINITGAKYHDLNGDGVRQTNEPGLAGWTFFLYTVTGGVVSTVPLQVTTTNAHGDYGFFDLGPLPSGTSYVVAEQQGSGWTQSAPQAAAPNAILLPNGQYGFVVAAVSGVPMTTGGSASGTGTLTLNQRNNNTTATVTYNDGAGHSGTATLYVSQFNVTWNGAGGPANFNTFCIDLVHAVTVGQTYQVAVQANLAPDFTNASRIAYVYQRYGMQDLSSDPIQAAAVQVALWALSLDGNVPTHFVHNTDGSYSSADAHGVLGDLRIAWGANGNAAAIMAQVNEYLGQSLSSTAHGGWFDAALSGDASNRGQSMLVPTSVYWFGNYQPVSISGRKFEDRDGDGTDDGGTDPGLGGWTIELQTPAGEVLQTTVTATDGSYAFAHLVPGSYRVREVQQSGWTQTTTDPTDFTLVSGQHATEVDFGNFERVDLSALKFHDLDGDGERDDGEAGLAGWVIYLDANGNDQFDPGEINQTTDANGLVTFTDLGPGAYTLREVGQAGWTQSTDDPATIQLSSGQYYAPVEFGNFELVTISGYKFEDLDGDGHWESGESGLQHWTILLETAAGVLVDTVVTDSNGFYRFTEVGPGTYRVREQQQSGWEQTTDNHAPFAVVSGGTYQDLNFGNLQVACDLEGLGEVLVLPERVEFEAVVATFTSSLAGADTTDFTAQIIWGDGTSTAGVIAGANGSFIVTGTHTYLYERPYAIAVEIHEIPTGCNLVEISYAAVFSVDDDDRLQTVVDWSVTGTGTILQTQDDWVDDYDIDAWGYYTFTVDSLLRDEQYHTVERTRTGTVAFAVTESGFTWANGFQLDYFSLAEVGSAALARTVWSNDLSVVSTLEETGAEEFVLTHTGNNTTGAFSWSEEHDYSRRQLEEGFRFWELGQYERTTDVADRMELEGQGNYLSGLYSKTTTHTTNTSRQEAGSRRDWDYTLSEERADAATVTQSENVFTAHYTLTGTQSYDSTLLEAAANPAGEYLRAVLGSGSGTLHAFGNDTHPDGLLDNTVTGRDRSTLTETGNQLTHLYDRLAETEQTLRLVRSGLEVTGDYSLTADSSASFSLRETGVNQTLLTTQYQLAKSTSANQETGNYLDGGLSRNGHNRSHASTTLLARNQTSFTTVSGTQTDTSAPVQLGNTLAGDFTLTEPSASSSATTETNHNQTSKTTVTGFTTGSMTLLETGNNVSGTYTLADSSTQVARSTQTNVNQTSNLLAVAAHRGSAHRDETGNNRSGDYRLLASGFNSADGEQTLVNQTSESTVTSAGTDGFTLHESGNHLTTNYTLSQSATGHSTTAEKDQNQTYSGSATSTGRDTITLQQTGHRATTDFSLSQTASSGSTTTQASKNQTVTSSATVTDSGTAQLYHTGNNLTGLFSLTQEADSTSTSRQFVRNLTDGIPVTTTGTAENVAFNSLRQTGNSVTGLMSLTQSSVDVHDAAQTVENQTSDSTLVSGGVDFATVQRTGNTVTGLYSASQGMDGAQDSTLTARNQTVVSTQTVSEIHGQSQEQTGNAVTGEFSLSQSGSSTTTSGGLEVNDTDGELVVATNDGASSVSQDLTRTGNAITGLYSVSQTDAGSSTATLVEENQSLLVHATLTDASTDHQESTGNSVTADFSLTQHAEGTSQTRRSSTNSTDGAVAVDGDSASTSSSTVDAEQTGNAITGLFHLTQAAASGLHATQTVVNQSSTSRETATHLDFSTLERTGNSVTGHFQADQTVSGFGDATQVVVNQTTTSTVTVSDINLAFSLQTGNSVTSAFSLSQSASDTTTSSFIQLNATDGIVAASEGDESATQASEVRHTGNQISGLYRLSQTTTSTSSSTLVEENQTVVTVRAATGAATADSERTGNSVTGAFSLTQTDRSTQTTDFSSTNTTDGEWVVTEGHGTGGATTDTDQTGNDISGKFQLAQVVNGGSDLTQTVFNQTSTSRQTTSAVDSSTLARTGNQVVGAFDAEETLSGSSHSQQVVTNQTATDSITVFGTHVAFSRQTGNSINGRFSLSQTGSDHSNSEFANRNATDGILAGADGSETGAQQTTLVQTGNEITGLYELSQTVTGTSTSEVVETNQTQTASRTVAGSNTLELVHSGNSVTGSFTLSQTDTQTQLTRFKSTNDTDGIVVSTQGRGSDSLTLETGHTGNDVSGKFRLLEFSQSQGESAQTVDNQTSHSSQTALAVDVGSSLRTGNQVTGGFTLDENSGGVQHSTQASSNQTTSATVTYHAPYDAVVHQTGNSVNGKFSLSQTGTDSSDSQSMQVNATDGVAVTAEATGTGGQQTTLVQTGNQVTGLYRLSQTVAGTSSSEVIETNQTITASRTLEGSSTLVAAHSGNSVTGSFTLTQTDTQTQLTRFQSTNATDGITVTTIGRGSDSLTLETGHTGNNISSKFALLEFTQSSSGSAQTVDNQTSHSSQTALAVDVSSAQRTGNQIVGGFTLDQNSGGVQHSTQASSNHTARATVTYASPHDAVLHQTGNSVSGNFSLSQTGTDGTSSLYQNRNVPDGIAITGIGADTARASTTLTQTGNQITGRYELSQTVESSSTSEVVETNQTLTTSRTVEGSSTQELFHSGNSVTGSFTLAQTDTQRQLMESRSTNGTDGVTVSTRGQGTDSLTLDTQHSGNSVSGKFRLVESSNSRSESAQTVENQTSTSRQTVLAVDAGSTTRTGNHVVGGFTLDQNGGGSQHSTQGSSNQTTTATVTYNGHHDAVAQQTGNSVSGKFSLSQSGTETGISTFRNVNLTDGEEVFAIGQEERSATTESQQTGNQVVGDYSLSQTATSSSSGSVFELNQTLATNRENTGTETAHTERTGNSVTGHYSLTQTEDSVSQSRFASDNFTDSEIVSSEGDTSASLTARTERSGNALTGAFRLQRAADSGDETSTTVLNQSSTSTLSSSGTAVDNLLQSGNEVVGGYTLSEGVIRFQGSTQTSANQTVRSTQTVSGTDFLDTLRTGNSVTSKFTLSEHDESRSRSQQRTDNVTDGITDRTEGTVFASQTLDKKHTGNQITGTFSLSQTVTSSQSVQQLHLNQTLTVSATVQATDTAKLEQSGNSVVGDFKLTQTETGRNLTHNLARNLPPVDGPEVVDQTRTTVSVSSTGDRTQAGNSVTSKFTLSESDRSSTTTQHLNTNQTRSSSGTAASTATSSVRHTGNSIVGGFSLANLGTVRNQAQSTMQNQTSKARSVQKGSETADRYQTGNSVTSKFSLSESVTHGFVSTPVVSAASEENQTQESDVTVSDSLTTTRRHTGNQITGLFSLSEQERHASRTELEFTNWPVNGAFTKLETIFASTSAARERTGNSLVGDFRLDERSRSRILSEGYIDNRGRRSDLQHANRTRGTLTQVGNSVSGQLTLTQAESGGVAARQAVRNQESRTRNTDLRSRDGERRQTANSVTGAFSLSQYDESEGTFRQFMGNAPERALQTVATLQTDIVDQSGNSLSGQFTIFEDHSNVTELRDRTRTRVAATPQPFAGDDTEEESQPNGNLSTQSLFRWHTGNSIVGTYHFLEDNFSASRKVETRQSGIEILKVTVTVDGESTLEQTGHQIRGEYSLSQTGASTQDTRGTGIDSRGLYTLSELVTGTRDLQRTGNQVTGSYDSTVTAKDETWQKKDGIDFLLSPEYSRTEASAGTLTARQSGNEVTGLYTISEQDDRRRATLTEAGAESNASYSLTETFFLRDRVILKTGNSITSSFSLYQESNDERTLRQSGSNSHGTYQREVRQSSSPFSEKTGHELSGQYSISLDNGADRFTLEETSTHRYGNTTVTETKNHGYSQRQSGNLLTGQYTLREDGRQGTTFQSRGRNATGVFSVSEEGDGAPNFVRTGNTLSGQYTLDQEDNSFRTLLQTGTTAHGKYSISMYADDKHTVYETGNALSGVYRLWNPNPGTNSGQEWYTLTEDGDHGGQHYNVSLNGRDFYVVQEEGNRNQGGFRRVTTGGGPFHRHIDGNTTHFEVATTSLDHTVDGNSLSGHMTLGQASTANSRYNLLYSFNNTSNVADVFATPGAIVFSPVGRTYQARFGPAERAGVPDYYAEPEPADELRGNVRAQPVAQPDKGFWESAKTFVGRFLYMVEQSRRSELPTAWASNTDYVMANVADIVGWGQSPGQKLMHLVGIQQQSNALNAQARALGLREQRINVFTTVATEAGEGAVSGAKTGGKAVWNATVDTVVSTATLGFYDGPEWAKFGVTQEDWRNGYGISYGISRVGFELTVGIATGSAAGKAGWVGKAAFAFDMAGNASAVGRSAYSIKKEGANFGNVVEGLGGLFGLGGNALGALGRGVDGTGAGGRGLSGALGTSESIVAAGGRGGGFQAFVSGWGKSLGHEVAGAALELLSGRIFLRPFFPKMMFGIDDTGDLLKAGSRGTAHASSNLQAAKSLGSRADEGLEQLAKRIVDNKLSTIDGVSTHGSPAIARAVARGVDDGVLGFNIDAGSTKALRDMVVGKGKMGVEAGLDHIRQAYKIEGFKLHDIIENRIRAYLTKMEANTPNYTAGMNQKGIPGVHAEVVAVNNLLNRIGFKGTDAEARALVSVAVRQLFEPDAGSTKYALGAPFVRCDRCSRILAEFDVPTDPLKSTARTSGARFLREMGIE